MPTRLASLSAMALVTLAHAASAQPADVAGAPHAQIVAKRYTTLSSEVPARIERIPVREGDRFKEGQLLVALDCSLQRSQWEEARAHLAAAEKVKAVNKRLVELNSAGALEATVAEAEAAKADAKARSAQVVLSKCAVAAPFAGRVVEQKVREHQYVQPGQAMLDILDDSTLEAEFFAPSRALGWIKVGSPFQVSVDETGKSYPAKVTRIAAKVDPVSHSAKIVGEIVGGSDLVAGMSGRVLITPSP